MRKSILLLLLIAILVMPMQSKMTFDFKCKGTGGTFTSYSYVKEPRLEEDGYTRGLKTGSFNYLENAQKIDFQEHISYKYGNGTNRTNSSIDHDLYIDFDGDRGISKFYGTGFYKNNRAVSAFKEIRYENIWKYENISPYSVSPVTTKNANKFYKTTLGRSYNASDFTVNARLTMDTAPGVGYNLKYKAEVKDAVVETRDRTGWTNRTGARRTDFEHSTLIRGGELTVYNNLSDTAPFPTGPGSVPDWLPCCYSGTLPPIDGLDTGWPSSGTFGTLKPAKLLPNCKDKCIEICKNKTCKNPGNPAECKSCSQECIDNCTWKCEENNCPGYECINTYQEGLETAAIEELATAEASIFVEKLYDANTRNLKNEMFYKTEDSTEVTEVDYYIRVKNSGDTKLYGVTLNDTLPGKMMYGTSGYYNTSSEEHEIAEKLEPETVENDDGTTKLIQWKLGDLNTGQEKKIKLTVRHKTEEPGMRDKYKENAVEASGLALGKVLVKDAKKEALISPEK